jgi:hypothetical protein
MSLLKEKDQALIEGVTLSKIKAFRCFHRFQVAVANTSKKKGFLKIPRAVAIISESSMLSSRVMPIDCQQPFLKLQFQNRWSLVSNNPSSQSRHIPLSLSEKLFLISISLVFRRSLARSQKKDLILEVHFDFQIHEEKVGA